MHMVPEVALRKRYAHRIEGDVEKPNTYLEPFPILFGSNIVIPEPGQED